MTRIAASTRAAASPGCHSDSAKPATAASSSNSRQPKQTAKLRSKPMLLHAPIKGAARQAEFGGGRGDVIGMLLQRALDHLLFRAAEMQNGVHDWRRRNRMG